MSATTPQDRPQDSARLTAALEDQHTRHTKARERAAALRRSLLRVTTCNVAVAAILAGGNWAHLPNWSRLGTLTLTLLVVAVGFALARAGRHAAVAGTDRQVKRLGRLMLATAMLTQGALLAVVAAGSITGR